MSATLLGRKHFFLIQKFGKRKIYIVFAPHHLCFLKCSDCSQVKFDHCSCWKNKHTACMLSNDRKDHSITIANLKLFSTVDVWKSHYLTRDTWWQIKLATCYHSEIHWQLVVIIKQPHNKTSVLPRSLSSCYYNQQIQNSFPSITKNCSLEFTSYSLYNVVHTTMTKPFCTHFGWRNKTP